MNIKYRACDTTSQVQKKVKKERKIERTEIVRVQNTEDMLASAEETECAASHWN